MRIAYLLLIAASNLMTAKFDPFVLAEGALIIPVGSIFVGTVFVLRDLIQMKHGRASTYTVIIWATGLSMSLNILTGETAHVALASLIAFLVGEIVDTEVFTRKSGNLASKVLLSGIVGGTLDSVVFVTFGLSPIGAAVLPWDLVPACILGQVVAKLLLQFLAAGWLARRKLERENNQ